ncbi:hypothetical protein [Niveibacterium sp. SC-1]|uniref:DUF3024 domain-containing protein n=1 Tax=Niveibacterium sp. SC-1 TaxID=3135646 RepID=UPI00311D8DE7
MPDRVLPASQLVGEAELVRRRVMRALRSRQRYRYVAPEVSFGSSAWFVRSPCCSRNVDQAGGVIDIARIEHSDGSWLLYNRDHAEQLWVMHGRHGSLGALMGVLCADEERCFWP